MNDGKITNPNRIKSSDYKAWDKFDVEQECEKIDQNDSTPVSGQKVTFILPLQDVYIHILADRTSCTGEYTETKHL